MRDKLVPEFSQFVKLREGVMINLFLIKHTPPTSISEIILIMSYFMCSSHAYAYGSSSLWTYVYDLTSKLEAIMSLSNPVFHVFKRYVM